MDPVINHHKLQTSSLRITVMATGVWSIKILSPLPSTRILGAAFLLGRELHVVIPCLSGRHHQSPQFVIDRMAEICRHCGEPMKNNQQTPETGHEAHLQSNLGCLVTDKEIGKQVNGCTTAFSATKLPSFSRCSNQGLRKSVQDLSIARSLRFQ